MANVLFTGGRAPATLELARAFQRAGHVVFMAESLRGYLSQPSNVVAKNIIVPPPRQRTKEFIQAVQQIVFENKIDLLVPTCEEVFYVAMGRDKFSCRTFVESLERLESLHNKWKFIRQAELFGLSVPQTMLIQTTDDLVTAFACWKNLVLKPVYSRFATRTLILPTREQAFSTVAKDSARAWVAQEFIPGRQICTYSIAHRGHITAHSAYRSEFTAGQGAAIAFQCIEHEMIFNWIQNFVKTIEFTGQVAFDFIVNAEGKVFALECNPRATSGIHLLAREPKFVEAFFDDSQVRVSPRENSSPMLSTAMLIYGLLPAVRSGSVRRWLSTFLFSRDVIFDLKDPLPFLLQWRSILQYLKLSRRENISPLAASTFDIEWNGELEHNP